MIKYPTRFKLRDRYGNLVLRGEFKFEVNRVRLEGDVIYYAEDPDDIGTPPRTFHALGVQDKERIFVEAGNDDLGLPG